MSSSWFAKWFPQRWWGPWFPGPTPNPILIPGVGPAGAATFALDLEGGAQLTMSWVTDIQTAEDGTETRRAILDAPKRKISGQAYLLGDATRATRVRLGRYMKSGQPFLLSLPYEELTLAADAAAKVVSVHSGALALVDWNVKGQRVVVQNGDDFAKGVVQAVASDSITLDMAPGDLAVANAARIMPTVAIFLEPQQGFARYPNPDGIERWAINARMIPFGFEIDPRAARLTSGSSGGAMDGVVFGFVALGAAGNAFTLSFAADGADSGELDLTGSDYVYHFEPGVTFVDEVLATIAEQGLTIYGSFNASAFLSAGDVWGPVSFSDGADKSWGTVGTGATVTTYLGRPVWDRAIGVDGSASDSIQAMNEIVDMGAVLFNVGFANAADWGRQVLIRDFRQEEWQWLKLFLSTVYGRQIAFWLPTWRADLTAVSFISDQITILGPSDEDGGLATWWPSQRTEIQVMQTDGTITYLSITGFDDNGDGTLAVYVSAPLSGADIEMISWLELCRFASDDFQVTFNGPQFELNTQARVVQQ